MRGCSLYVREETLVCDLLLLCLGKQYKRQVFDIAWCLEQKQNVRRQAYIAVSCFREN